MSSVGPSAHVVVWPATTMKVDSPGATLTGTNGRRSAGLSPPGIKLGSRRSAADVTRPHAIPSSVGAMPTIVIGSGPMLWTSKPNDRKPLGPGANIRVGGPSSKIGSSVAGGPWTYPSPAATDPSVHATVLYEVSTSDAPIP